MCDRPTRDRSFRTLAWMLTFFAVPWLIACDSGDEADRDEGESILVHFEGNSFSVLLDSVGTQRNGEIDVVNLAALVDSANLDRPRESLFFDFGADDGYRPSSRDNCAGVIPVTGEKLIFGHVDLATRNLLWDESLEFPGCARVKSLSDIYAATDREGTDPVTLGVHVSYYGIRNRVDMESLPTESRGDALLVSLSDIVEASDFLLNLNNLRFDVISKDGVRPGVDDECQSLVPLTDEYLRKGHVDLATHALIWEESLKFPACMYLTDLGTIVITEKTAPHYTVTVAYRDESYPLSLHAITPEMVQGEPLVSIATLLQEAGIGTALESLLFDFEAGDSYRSGTQAECHGIVPMPGSEVYKGYVSQESHRLVWPFMEEVPTCLALKNVILVWVMDDARQDERK